MQNQHSSRSPQRSSAMWSVALMLAIVFIGIVLPTPIYRAYSRYFHFSQVVITLIYAVYVAGTLAALLFFGRLSDQIGRRTAILPAIGIVAVSMLVFIFTIHTAMLFAARVLFGFATGIVSGSATAWIVELHPKHVQAQATLIVVLASEIGLAIGPLMTGLLAQFAPLPLRLTYIAYLPLLALAAAIAWKSPETVEQARNRAKDNGSPCLLQGISLRPRLGVPAEIRKQFVAPAATAFATFALSGIYFALIPGLLAHVLHLTGPAVSGALVFELSLAAAIAVVVTQPLSGHKAMLTGMVLMLPALALLQLTRELASLPLLLGTTAIAGVAIAVGYRGSLEMVNRIAPGDQRAEVVSTYFVACYIGLALPVIGVGLLSAWIGSETANLTFSVLVAIFAILAIVMGLRYAPK